MKDSDSRKEQPKPKSGLRIGSRIAGVIKGEIGSLAWRGVLYAIPLLGLGAYTAALDNFAKQYVTLSNGEWIVQRGKDVVSLGDNAAIPGGVPTGVQDFIIRYAYQMPLLQIGSIVVFVGLVELALFRRRHRKSIHRL